ncbi:Scramblase-domain-containing protein [Pluteus cervinus]|uniref:Scramblase-domain-containing protein n=1 Tax=Pluteus cervinus TaxID=181527 RepID=A0ACD3BEG1_9AGAR|nr:Scramblase-domain-containing protein [Pluteus cervinus]
MSLPPISRFYFLRRRCNAQQLRSYALSRFTDRPVGASRTRPRMQPSPQKSDPELTPSERSEPLEEKPSAGDSPLWRATSSNTQVDSVDGLRTLLENQTLVIERQLEMLNVFIGFEQSNKYMISNDAGEPIGYIAEEPKGFLAVIARQAFATHRPFRAVILDASGAPLLWIRRPFAWINSRMYVQRLSEQPVYTPGGELVLDTFAEVQQRWHFWRRRYDLFVRDTPRRILSPIGDQQPEPEPVTFNQFSNVDAGFLAWNFALQDARGEDIAFISRAFRGFGREIFTDTGRYSVNFSPRSHFDEPQVSRNTSVDLSLDQRASILALAVNIDFDYFSRHSGGGGLLHFGSWD